MSTFYFTYFVHTSSGIDQVLLDLSARLIAKTPLRFEVHYVENGKLHEGGMMGKNATLEDLARLPRIPDSAIDYETAARIAPRVTEIVAFAHKPQTVFTKRVRFLGAGWPLIHPDFNGIMPLVAIPPSLPDMPPSFVRVVATYTGQFTIGDPRKPLLEFPIKCVPYTREASASKLAHTTDTKRTRTAVQSTSKGPIDGTETIEKGFKYMNKLVPMNTETLNIMQGEFQGARVTENAFELVGTVNELPPWVLMDKTDLVQPTQQPGAQFLATFSKSLAKKRMFGIARKSKRGTAGKKKGSVEILALIPHNNTLMATRLPFDHEYTGFYRFARLQTTPDAFDEELDTMMGELVRNSTADLPIEPIRNEKIVRTGHELLKNIVQKYNPEYLSKTKESVQDLEVDENLLTELDDTLLTHTNLPISLLREGTPNYKLSQQIASTFRLTKREQIIKKETVHKEYYAEPNPDINDLL